MPASLLPTIIKQLYYDQQLLRLDDFVRAQQFHSASQALQASFLCTPGILSGLTLRLGERPGQVLLSSGAALDGGGRILLLSDTLRLDGAALRAEQGDFTIDLNAPRYAAPGAPRIWWLSLAFHEEPVPDTRNQAVQQPALLISAEAVGGAEAVPLARITVVPAGAAAPQRAVVSIDERVASAATLRPTLLPALDAGRLTTGTLSVERLPPIPAGKISGALDAAQIPALDSILRRLEALERAIAVGPTSGDLRLLWSSLDGVGALHYLDSSGSGTLGPGGLSACVLAVDSQHRKLYYGGTATTSAIGRMNFDGSEHEVLLSGRSAVQALAVDPANGYLFWGEGAAGSLGAYHRATLAGQEVTALATDQHQPSGITVDGERAPSTGSAGQTMSGASSARGWTAPR